MVSSMLRRWGFVFAVALVLLVSAAVVYAATFITQLTGPVWDDGANTYTFTVCSNTNLSDNICMEYDINQDNNFTALACSFTSLDSCVGSGGTGSTWTCVAPEVANATPFRYQFFRADASQCTTGRDLFTGFSTFNTGANAVTLRSLQARPAASPVLPLAGASLVVLGLAGVALRRRRQ